jgi:DNA-binding response OmpR family regulator
MAKRTPDPHGRPPPHQQSPRAEKGELSYSLIARLHEQGVPVILVSGSSESLSGLPVEAATILEKPFSEAQLLASLRPLLTQKEPR